MQKIFTFLLFMPLMAWAVEPVPKKNEQEVKIDGAIKIEENHKIKLEDSSEKDSPTSDSAPASQEPQKPDSSAVTKNHHFGVATSLGFPHVLNYGLHYMNPTGFLSAGLSTGSFAFNYSQVAFQIQNTELALRVHPWKGAFCVGVLAGQQKVKGKKTENFTSPLTVSVTGELELKSQYITPHIGWLWGASESGFFGGLELGLQIPSGVSSDYKDDAPVLLQSSSDYRKFVNDLTTESERLGKLSLPHLAIKLGWIF